MFSFHIYLDGELIGRPRLEHCPRVGDTIRLPKRAFQRKDRFAKVTEVVWCMDEESVLGQRVNLRLESEK